MATLIPFRGVRYNLDQVALDDVVTPPYDVIDPTAQADFYAKNPYNVIRLELGYKEEEDNENSNRYTRASEFFQQWLAANVLLHEDQPAIYLYEQEFEAKGEQNIRTGFLCGVKVEDYAKGVVLPHEETLPKHKADRLELLRTAKANFSPIFGLYADQEYDIDRTLAAAKGDRQPDGQVVEPSGVINRLWVITNQEVVNQVVNFMVEKRIFIADGHHRYETSLNYAKEMAEQGLEGYDYIMMALVNLFDPGLVVFPTHRLVRNLEAFKLDTFLKQLEDLFTVETLPAGTSLSAFLTNMEKSGKDIQTFGLYAGGDTYHIFKLKNQEVLQDIEDNHSAAWRKLDVSILHSLVLEKLLGIGSQQRADESNLTYTREEEFAIEAVRTGEYQVAFFMNPTKVEEVTEIATGGEKMPQKSTFFYPKVITGLVINDFTR